MAWADVAKGGCILLVLLWHVIMKDYLQIDWLLGAPVAGVWGEFGELLLPLRMPLFFTISGMLAATAVHRPWRAVGRSRIARFLYLYVVWLLVHTAVLALAPGFPTDRATSPGELLAQLTVTPSNLWYLHALALYFVLAKALRRVHPAVLLAAAGALSAVASAGLVDTPGNRAGLYQNLVFFLAGLHLRRHVRRWAGAVTVGRLLLAAGAYAAALAVVATTGGGRLPGVAPLVSVLAVLFGIAVAVRLARWPAVGDPLAALGRQTLPIYVIHMPVLALLHRLVADPIAALDDSARLALALGFPLSLTALVLALSLGVHRVLLAARATWLFDLPASQQADRTDKGDDMSRTDPPVAAPAQVDVTEAARWLDGQVLRTPLLHSAAIDRLAGVRVLLKAENLQTGGSYKMRGGLYAAGRLAAAGHTGVVAQSTGNHAVAVALAARRLGLAATVVLPADAAPTKVARARAAGARVILTGVTVEERLAVVRRISEETGHPIVDAYDHPDVIAGQGTASLELIEEAERAGTPLDALVLPVGGGGGVAGACLAAEGRSIEVYGVEPVGCDSLALSLATGRPTPVGPAPTIADGLRPACVGELPFAILRTRLRGVVRVDDEEIAEAFRLLLMELKVLAEPSGAAGLAGALRLTAAGVPGRPGADPDGADGPSQRTVGVVLTGGNVEADLVARLAAPALLGEPAPALLKEEVAA
nr:pyridoxal-phosphate dependent enzyme [Micromonospora tarapacensis]